MSKNLRKDYVKSQLSSAKRRLKYCDNAIKENDYSYVIRECQSIVEFEKDDEWICLLNEK